MKSVSERVENLVLILVTVQLQRPQVTIRGPIFDSHFGIHKFWTLNFIHKSAERYYWHRFCPLWSHIFRWYVFLCINFSWYHKQFTCHPKTSYPLNWFYIAIIYVNGKLQCMNSDTTKQFSHLISAANYTKTKTILPKKNVFNWIIHVNDIRENFHKLSTGNLHHC